MLEDYKEYIKALEKQNEQLRELLLKQPRMLLTGYNPRMAMGTTYYYFGNREFCKLYMRSLSLESINDGTCSEEVLVLVEFCGDDERVNFKTFEEAEECIKNSVCGCSSLVDIQYIDKSES